MASGEVNMAGVGRRGFQAAAQAALLAASLRPGNDLRTPPPGMDGRRSNVPRQLNINAAFTQDQGIFLSLPISPSVLTKYLIVT